MVEIKENNTIVEIASTSGELTKLDLKKWGINMLKYVVPSLLLSLTTYLQTNNEWSWVGLGTALLGALIDITHRWLTNNHKPL